jgi:hypothetical protein
MPKQDNLLALTCGKSYWPVMERTMDKDKVHIDAQAAGVAAYDLVQKVFLLLIERVR